MTSVTSTTAAHLDSGIGSSPQGDEPTILGLRASSFLKIATIGGLFILLFWPNLRRLWDKTNPFTGEPNWGHAVAVPIIGLYYLYINRDRLRQATVRPGWTGLPIALFGILFFAYGIYPGQNDLFKDIGMVITLFGVVTLLCGWQVMKVAWFPIVFLFCALPWPGLVYSRVAEPLQKLAATVAVKVLHVFSVESGQFGTKIFIVGNKNVVRTLNVAEACAGLRSLMTFVSVAAAVAFLSSRAMWQKLVLVASAVPIAIFCNVMRVSGQGLLDRYVSPQLSESFAHQFVGLIMLIPAFFLILLVAWVLQNLFIEEVDDKSALKAKGSTQEKRAAKASDEKVVRRAPAAVVAAAPAAPAPRPAAAPRPPTAPAVMPPRPVMTPPRPTLPGVRPSAAPRAGAQRSPQNPDKPANPPTDRPSSENR